MSYTPLFVELVVIGVGTAIWLLLLAAALSGRAFNPFRVLNDKLPLVLLLGIVYVLGIVTDRSARDLFMPTVEQRAMRRVFTPQAIAGLKKSIPDLPEGNLSMDLEKRIRAGAPGLAAKIDYNRSRLRICRSWVIHFALMGIAFVLWNVRTRRVGWKKTMAIVALDVFFFAMTVRTTIRLAEDHQRDLLESSTIMLRTRSRALARRPAPARTHRAQRR